MAVNTGFWFTGEGGRLYSIVFGLPKGKDALQNHFKLTGGGGSRLLNFDSG